MRLEITRLSCFGMHHFWTSHRVLFHQIEFLFVLKFFSSYPSRLAHGEMIENVIFLFFFKRWSPCYIDQDQSVDNAHFMWTRLELLMLFLFSSYLHLHLKVVILHFGGVENGGCFLLLKAWQLEQSWFVGCPNTLTLLWQLDGYVSSPFIWT